MFPANIRLKIASVPIVHQWSIAVAIAMATSASDRLDILLVQKPWAKLLAQGHKTWELRSTKTSAIGKKIAIGQTVQCLALGEVTVTDCILVAVRDASGKLVPPEGCEDDWLASEKNLKLHCVKDPVKQLPDKWKKVYAWVMSSAHEYEVPIPYKHANGCVTWISSNPKAAKSCQSSSRKKVLKKPSSKIR